MASISSYARLMRLNQPVGIWLLLWPCWWSLALVSRGTPAPRLLALFALGAVLMRSAGCIVNDLWDRKIDAQVARTAQRPLANGEITAIQALALLSALLALSLIVAWALGFRVVMWAAAALPPVVVYPLMKRITWWPQAFLGLTFNWGALLGSVAVLDRVASPAWLLYAAGFFWTLGYDTIYALQDKDDDALVGVKSTARRLKNRVSAWIMTFYLLCLLCLADAGAAQGARWEYRALLLLPLGHFIYQIIRLKADSPAVCRRVFLSNIYAGALIFFACWFH